MTLPHARPVPNRTADALDAVVPELDQLCADVRHGTYFGRPDQRQEGLEERGQRIAAAIQAAFRGRAARAVAPPLGRQGSGAWF